MKKFFLGILTAIAVLLVIKFFLDRKEARETLEADSALIQTQIANVSKLVVTEGHFAEVISYTDSQKFFMDLLSFDKKILIVVNADVTVSYDLHKVVYDIDEVNKKVIIKSIPDAEVKIYPKMKYYDVSQNPVNPFGTNDVNKIQRRVNEELEKKVAQSGLKKNAENRLISELANIIFLTKSIGWTLEYNSLPIENVKDLEIIEKH
ncbi:DUF4230 domain-containing protein [Capnocytophaga stomatis]|uniref:DUF4230 domain-containing protein n=1 Tax=Capnocytophaga stomatis TaxID=1848904 RepID=UPI001ACF868D|nr:DUF4230 domain-containing protein [Capnocytophaga stomatis]GIM50419.1 hypothetical protein CAPN003_18710 [Capnocytophaga stomatis]